MSHCPYAIECQEFIKSLNVPDAFLHSNSSRCYCEDKCFAKVGGPLYRGEPKKLYCAPKGWYRQGIRVPAQTWAVKAFRRWHRAYHGTNAAFVNRILNSGGLLIPGDETLGGHKLSYRPGHFTPKHKPKGFDINQVFVSPSINYAGHDAYATPEQYQNKQGKNVTSKVAFQVLIEPGCYTIGTQTVGATSPIDDRIDNGVLEWSTRRRGAVIIYGLLVKLKADAPGSYCIVM